MSFFNSKARKVASAIQGYGNSVPTPTALLHRRPRRRQRQCGHRAVHDQRSPHHRRNGRTAGHRDGDPGNPRVVFLSDSKSVALLPRPTITFRSAS